MKITKSRLKELIKEVLKENEPFKDRPFDYSSLMRDEDNPFSPEGKEEYRTQPIEIQGPAVISVQYEGSEPRRLTAVKEGESFVLNRA